MAPAAHEGHLGHVAYLDHGATSPLRPEALAAMLPYLTEHFGNPSGSHAVARAARRAVEDARDVVAAHLGCQPGEVVFTAGGTEADNLAVLGVHGERGGTVVCSSVEHHAVVRACGSVGGVLVAVDRSGRVDLDALRDVLDGDVSVVSVMAANNEVGTIQPLADIAALVRLHAPRAALHTDAVAAVPWLDISSATEPFHLVSVSAHKFGGPRGSARWWCEAVQRSRRCSMAVLKNATAGPEPTTWPGSSAWRRRCRLPWRRAPSRYPGCRRCATGSRPV